MTWLKDSDVVIAEVSTPSLGVGYEIREAEILRKRILCLYRTQDAKRLSAMLTGDRNLPVREYTSLEEAVKHIDDFLKLIS